MSYRTVSTPDPFLGTQGGVNHGKRTVKFILVHAIVISHWRGLNEILTCCNFFTIIK